MNRLLIGLLGVLAFTNQLAAATNATAAQTNASAKAANPNDPVEKEYQKLLDADDAAQSEVDQWIHDNKAFAEQGGGLSNVAMQQKIEARFVPIRKAYEDFLQRQPNHTNARLAFGSFLLDTKDEEGAEAQWEKARELDPKNPAAWNNLAELFTHHGPITNAFDYYSKAIELNPNESLYYHNFGNVIYLFRKDAMEHYSISEQEVFTKALALLQKAIKLDPDNFPLATDVAQTYYGIKPTRTEDALAAWNYALKIAHDEIEREGVYVHLARFKLHAARFDEARTQLNAVTNEMYTVLKNRLLKNINEQEKQAKETNSAPAAVEKK